MANKEPFLEIPELVQAVKDYLFSNYEPTSNPLDATVHEPTTEIFRKLQLTFPGHYYQPYEVSLWLMEGGFKIADFGGLKPEWLLKDKNINIIAEQDIPSDGFIDFTSV